MDWWRERDPRKDLHVSSITPATTPVTPTPSEPAPAPAVVTPPTAITNSAGIMVKLAAAPQFGTIQRMPRGAERKAAAWNAVVTTAQTSQAPFVELAEKLKADGIVKSYETLVSPNMLIVEPASLGAAKQMNAAFQAMQGVKTIYSMRGDATWPPSAVQAASGAGILPQPGFGLDVTSMEVPSNAGPTEMPYGLKLVGAPVAWTAGANGTGLVYGSIDTGADYTHEAITNNYRGRNADGSFSHDYNWFDFGATRTPAPSDSHGHGTHTIGTVTGTAGEVPIGVAPKAKWVSVNGLKDNADVRLKSLQWMMAPTKLDGTEPDATKAPDVVGMSWWTGSPAGELFHESVKNLRAAGIEVTKSAGNNGPGPESISSPGQFQEIRGIAAVDANSDIASFSSRGPSPMAHAGRAPLWKPDYAAPGVDTLSSTPGNRYAKMSGTSMAQPHFSGALLAILSKYPTLNDYQLEKVLQTSAVDVGAKGRDLEFGYGIVNIPAALAAAEKLVAQDTPRTTEPAQPAA
jgi:hypothetical protein